MPFLPPTTAVYQTCLLCYATYTSDRNLLHKKWTNLIMTNRAFSQFAPTVWNSLPLNVISELLNLTTFKRLLKHKLYMTDC